MKIPPINNVQCGIIIYYNSLSGAINASSFNNEYHEGTYYGPTTDYALRIIHLYICGHNNKSISKFAKYDIKTKWEYLNRYVQKYKLGRLVLQIE